MNQSSEMAQSEATQLREEMRLLSQNLRSVTEERDKTEKLFRALQEQSTESRRTSTALSEEVENLKRNRVTTEAKLNELMGEKQSIQDSSRRKSQEKADWQKKANALSGRLEQQNKSLTRLKEENAKY